MGLIWGASLMLMVYGTLCGLVANVVTPAFDFVELGPCALPQNMAVKGKSYYDGFQNHRGKGVN